MKKVFSCIGEWVCEYWMLIVAAMFLFALGLLITTPSKYVRAPVESCAATYTGNTQVQDVPITTCASYDKNMACIVPITTYTQETISEVRIQCDFKEWR